MAYFSDFTKLPSGREFYTHLGIIGIDPGLKVHEGYDGHVYMDRLYVGDNDETFWTPAEKMELADLMIERWQRFKDAARTAAGHDV